MNESETRGRCRREFESYYADKQVIPSEGDWLLADALDRLAADVAAIKEATLPQTTEERDCAIRERDEARAEVGRLLGELAEAKAETQRIQDEADDREETERVKRLKAEIEKTHRALLNRTCERDEARAEAARLRMQLVACSVLAHSNTTESLEHHRQMHPDYDCDAVQSVILAVEREITARSEAERLKAELAARPAATGWLTDDERDAVDHGACLLEDAEDCDGNSLKEKSVVLSRLLARAGSQPVVEVPELHAWDRHQREEAQRYRDALDKAGVPWKEVPRE